MNNAEHLDTRKPLGFGLDQTMLSIGKKVNRFANQITIVHGNEWKETMSVVSLNGWEWITFDGNGERHPHGILSNEYWPTIHESSSVWGLAKDQWRPDEGEIPMMELGDELVTSLYCPVYLPNDMAVFFITNFRQPGTNARYCSMMRWEREPYGMSGTDALIQSEAFGMLIDGHSEYEWVIGAGRTEIDSQGVPRAIPTDYGRNIANGISPPIPNMDNSTHWPKPMVHYSGMPL